MIDKLREIVKQTHTRALGQVLQSKKNSDILEWILSESSDLQEVTIKERVWYILNDKPNAVCDFGKRKTFNPKTQKYGFCNNIKNCECFKNQLSVQRKGMDMSHVIEKRVVTWEKKYGVSNVSKLVEIQEKRKQTIEKSGKINEIYKRLAHERKSKGFEQVIERVKDKVIPLFSRNEYYGSRIEHKYKWQCITCLNSFIDYVDSGRTPICKICYPNSVSTGESEVRDFIASLGIMNIKTNCREILENKEYDIYLPDYKLAIEYNGVYWHSDKFKDKTYHVDKFLRSKNNGIHLINIFEDEWLTKKEIVKNRLRSLLGVNHKIFARKCTVKEITKSQYKIFTTKNHLQGYANAKYYYGLVLDDSIVAVMSFGKSRYTKDGYELIRYCSSHNVTGGASKLFTYFIKTVNPDLIVSYANRCWSKGTLYEKLGFINVTKKDNNIGYWYIKDNIRYHRSTFNKKRLIRMGENSELSEFEIMKNNGFLRIYDCGNYKYIWEKQQFNIK